MTIEVIEKEFDKKVNQKTVVDQPSIEERRTPSSPVLLMQVAEASQSFTPWGYNVWKRDQQLRDFWHTEPWLASVVYSVSIRNASFNWKVEGSDPEKTQPRNTIRAVNRILKNSNRGKGWIDLIVRTCIDLYSQDNGAFWEIIRKRNRPDSPVINIAHLDAARCQRTGDPEYPVIYRDRFGREKVLRYWQVRTIEEFPAPVEDTFGMQYCAVSRALLAAEIIQSISTYKMEKVSGNFTRAIDIVSGVTKKNIDDAIALAEEMNLNKGLYRYSLPVILPGLDPSTSLSQVHIDLASLPDNFDEDTSFKWYVAQLAAAFGVDYQEIAPLMTGNLGSSQQSEIMHLKTRGKGPALIMSIFENIINGGLIPGNVEFKFLEQDIRSEREKAETKFTRVKARAMQIKSGELSIQAARELAVAEGDLPRHLMEAMEELDEMNVQTQTDEFGPNQVEGGMDTQFVKMTMQDVKAIRKAVSKSPNDFLQRYKSSFGQPSCTVIGPLFNTQGLLPIKNSLLLKYANTRARYMPETSYHITLVHSPLADEMEMRALNRFAIDMSSHFPIMVSADRLSYFDTPNGKALVLLVNPTQTLKDFQRELYDKFVGLGVPVSEYSNPATWVPHVTLAYVEGEAEERYIPQVTMQVDYPTFTRTAYSLLEDQYE